MHLILARNAAPSYDCVCAVQELGRAAYRVCSVARYCYEYCCTILECLHAVLYHTVQTSIDRNHDYGLKKAVERRKLLTRAVMSVMDGTLLRLDQGRPHGGSATMADRTVNKS